MKVLKYEAHNVLRVSDVQMDMEGHHLYLVGGKNGQDTESALDGAFRQAEHEVAGCATERG